MPTKTDKNRPPDVPPSERTQAPSEEAAAKIFRHRIMNNFQVLSSLMNLQSHKLKDPTSMKIFQELQNRIVALTHEKLYGGQTLSRIELASYFNDLTSSLQYSFRSDAPNVRLSVDVRNVALAADMALPCGLIVNELASNALRHAFPGGRNGEIQVQLTPTEAGTTRITVRDNGIGFPEGLDYRNTESLGLKLVMMLSAQLEGTVALVRDGGTAFHIQFNGTSHA